MPRVDRVKSASLTASRRAAPHKPPTPRTHVCARDPRLTHAPPLLSGARQDRRVATDVPQEDSPRVCRRHGPDHRQHRPRRRRAAHHPDSPDSPDARDSPRLSPRPTPRSPSHTPATAGTCLSLEFLLTICENATSACRKMAVGGASFSPRCADALRMMLELEGDTADEVRGEARTTSAAPRSPTTMWARRLSIGSRSLGGEIMLPVLNACVDEMVSSADWKQHYAALIAISSRARVRGADDAALGAIVTKVVAHFGDARASDGPPSTPSARRAPRRRPPPRLPLPPPAPLTPASSPPPLQMSTDFGPEYKSSSTPPSSPPRHLMDDGCILCSARGGGGDQFCEHCEKETPRHLQGLLGKLRKMLQRASAASGSRRSPPSPRSPTSPRRTSYCTTTRSCRGSASS